jgi:hypothetical protein
MKVLFLDIDGVLNSTRTLVAFNGYPQELYESHLAMFDQVALGMVRGLCRHGEVKVVISSAWRKDFTFEQIGERLDLPTIGQTPMLLGCRGLEINAWLSQHPEVTQYAIVDDNPDMLPDQSVRFVQTSGEEGLTWRDFSKLCGLFDVNPHGCSPSRVRQYNSTALAWESE